MSDQIRNPAPRPARKRGSLGRSLLAVAAVATTSAAVIWSALFYNAANRHAGAGTATPVRGGHVSGTTQVAPAPAPVSTRTS